VRERKSNNKVRKSW